MIRQHVLRIMTVGMMMCCVVCAAAQVSAAQFKVMVVLSYDRQFAWERDIVEGILSMLGESSDIQYVEMNTKADFAGGQQKAQEAYALYQQFQPDGIITADDNAISMFVLPYIKDKVKTPVIFCGVNAEPEKYGFPASNVSGVLERTHYLSSLALAKQLVPTLKTYSFMEKKDPSAEENLKQLKKQIPADEFRFVEAKMPVTLKEALAMATELNAQSDALIMSTLTGLLDDNGKALTDETAVPLVNQAFGKPVLGTMDSQVAMGGILCTVAKTGQEQGTLAAEMLLKAMQGTPLSQLPITQNQQGKRVINVSTMKTLGITPKPEALRGVELVTTK